VADEAGTDGSGLDLVLSVARRRKSLAVIAFTLPFAASVSVISFLPNIYRSTAAVLVDRQQIPETFVRSTVTSALETRLHTISQEIVSRSRLEDLINRFGLYTELRRHVPFEAVIARMRADIKVDLQSVEARGQREATVAFTISYQGSDPQSVAIIANTLASFYVEENTRTRERQATSTAEFLQVQLADTKRRLDKQEQRVSEFKRRYLGELPQQLETNIATLERLHSQLRLNADNQTRASERRRALANQLAEVESLLSTPPAAAIPVATPTAIETSEGRLTQLREELARLRTQFSEKYPDVVRVAGEVAALERELTETHSRRPKADDKPPVSTSTAPSALTPYLLRLKEALGEVEADVKVFRAEEERLRDGIAAYQARIENVPRREQEFRELFRDYDSTRELYQTLLKRSEEAQLAENMEQRQKGEQFRVLDPAIPNTVPAAPNRRQLLGIALIASLGLAVAAVIIAEKVDTSFHAVDNLRAFSAVPVVVSIPLIVTRIALRRRRWKMRLAVGGALAALVLIVAAGYFAAHNNERLVLLLGRGGS
jgi:polysaccharide chain length determinant protein (PEP-CTERM system associated)